MNTLITPEVAANLDLIGDRWTLLILRDLFAGRHRFEALAANTGAGRATLTRRLVSLVEAGLVNKVSYSKGRSEYRLATKGRDLLGAAMLAWSWEQTYFPSLASQLPSQLIHTQCGHNLTAVAVCTSCGDALHRRDVQLAEHAGNLEQQLLVLGSENKQRKRRQVSGGNDSSLEHVAELVGDRWSILILVAMFFDVSRFDHFQKLLGIAPNILGERLNALVIGGIAKKAPYQEKPIRYRYLLTERGDHLYGFIMAVWQWAMDWVEPSAGKEPSAKEPSAPQELLIHAPCKHRLRLVVQCVHCKNSLTLNHLALS